MQTFKRQHAGLYFIIAPGWLRMAIVRKGGFWRLSQINETGECSPEYDDLYFVTLQAAKDYVRLASITTVNE